jgi:hypothetical protein
VLAGKLQSSCCTTMPCKMLTLSAAVASLSLLAGKPRSSCCRTTSASLRSSSRAPSTKQRRLLKALAQTLKWAAASARSAGVSATAAAGVTLVRELLPVAVTTFWCLLSVRWCLLRCTSSRTEEGRVEDGSPVLLCCESLCQRWVDGSCAGVE